MLKISDAKKCFICLFLVILMGILLVYTYSNDMQNEHAGIIRLHVIANSDSPQDQELKLKVRDAVIEYMNHNDGAASVDDTRRFLERNENRLEKIAEGIIAAEGFDYAANANIGVCFIPEKTYGNITFPAGNYEAMKVTLGKGEGQNWWCVLFPPLCLLDEGTEDFPENENSLELRWKVTDLLNK